MECFLCSSKSEDEKFCPKREKVKTFNDKILGLCKKYLEARKHFEHAYKDVHLPDFPDEYWGYHSTCYKEFNVKKTYMDKYNNFLQSSRSTTARPQLQSTSAADLEEDNNISEANSSRNATYNLLQINPHTSQDVDDINIIFSDTGCNIAELSEVVLSENESEDEVENMDDASDLKCFYCNKIYIYRKNRRVSCSSIKNKSNFFAHVKALATDMNDAVILKKIETQKNTNLAYHAPCKLQYFGKHKVHVNKPETDEWAAKRDFNKMAFEKLYSYVNEAVIENGRILSFTAIKHVYVDILSELYEVSNVEPPTNFSTASVRSKLSKQFKAKIKEIKLRDSIFITDSKFDVNNVQDDEISLYIFQQKLDDVAVELRRRIMKIKRNPLPDLLDADKLDQGECDIPQWLSNFIRTLLTGIRNISSERVERLTSSLAQDFIFSVSRGRILPRKHILLGMGVKSLTGSARVINFLNKLGHSASYSSIVELETSAAYTAIATKQLCPTGIITTPVLPSGVAWDNFDRFVERSGKRTIGQDTLHDTVGIMYQTVPTVEDLVTIDREREEREDNENELDSSISVRNTKGQRQRSLEKNNFEVLPPAKQKRPRLACNESNENSDGNLDESVVEEVPENLTRFNEINFCWMLSHARKLDHTPMWIGYNAKIMRDESGTQKVEYLTQINASPTCPEVVKETLRRSIKIADECNKTYYNVTYDLAMAKIAIRIQSAEDQFARLFIHLGSFHIILAFFKALGKFIDGMGLVNLLVDSNILAHGSIGTFIGGKHFNRCRKLHPLLSVALQILHFERFLTKLGPDLINDAIKEDLLQFNSQNRFTPKIRQNSLKDLFDKYETYKTKTLQGKHGKTPQIYLMYTTLVDLYFMLEFSIRTNDFDLFKYALTKMTNIFFAMNHINYARYLSFYINQLEHIEETHPGLLAESKDCFLGVRRTSKPFSRSPIDLTLEQTQNADAASRASGVINLTDSFSAREKWAITHSLRASLTSRLKDFCGLREKEDITKELRKSSIQNSAHTLTLLEDFSKQCTNPFSRDLSKDHLYNVSSGQTVDNRVFQFLSTVESFGEEKRKEFCAESLANPDRFDKVIKKNVIYNFAYQAKRKVKICGKVKEVQIQRDAFGRLLWASLKKKIDIEQALCYPLAPISFAFCHGDGTICKTPKSVVIDELLKYQPANVDVPDAQIHIYDGFYFLHILTNIENTYGKISEQIFKMIVSNKNEVHIIFDKFNDPSIKDYEHKLRGEEELYFDIKKQNKRNAEFSKLLRSSSFKKKFVEFLITDWSSLRFVPYLQGKKLKLNYDKCYNYELSSDNTVIRTVDHDLSCFHEEADTKIVFHITQFQRKERIQVHCTDSDIPVIMLANFHYRKSETEIIMNMSTSKIKLYLDINLIHKNMGDLFSRALAVCHVFTGNDFNPSFFRKGKKKPFKVLKNNQNFLEAFLMLIQTSPTQINLHSGTFRVMEEYVCRLYGLKTKNDVNKGRLEMFEKSYQFKKSSEDILQKKIKSCDASNFPPSKQELLQHVKRTMYISSIWCNAHKTTPTERSPDECGWQLIDGAYEFYWFDGPKSPKIHEISIENSDCSSNEDENDSEEEEYSYENESDEEGEEEDEEDDEEEVV